jgi:tetrahydromethanopterin S-methyltransferase subunit A
MVEKHPIENLQHELQEGMALAKCRKCGCMKETLETLRSSLSVLQTESSSAVFDNIDRWLQQMDAIKYACLGCEYCFPAVAMNVFHQTFPEAAQGQSLSCAFDVREYAWPPVPGEYLACCEGTNCPVAISTLASVHLVDILASMRPKELCIIGKTETENIGIDKVIKNTITNPTIRFLVLAGKDPQGHQPGRTFLALWEHGVDEGMRVIGSPGKRPVLRNVSREETEAFRRQVQVIDLIGCDDVEIIVRKIKELSQKLSPTCSCADCAVETKVVQLATVPVMQAKEPTTVEMDKAGYFVIIPQPAKGTIAVEHYTYDNRLLRVIEGKEARSIYWTMIDNGWVTQLSHAAYLGKELTKAELSIKLGFPYIQDGA